MGDQTNTPQLTIPSEIHAFLDSILSDAGMTTLDEDMREEMIKELYARLDSYITATIVKNMPEDKIEEFIKMNEEQRPRPEIEQFMQENIPDVQDVMRDAFTEFRDLYLGHVIAERTNAEDQSL